MNKNDDDYYERQSELLEQFLSKNDKTAFMKMLSMNINPSSDKEKNNNQKRHQFMKSMKNKSPRHYYDYFHLRQDIYNNSNSNKNNDLFNYNNNYQDNQINNYKLDFHNFFQDPEYKDKCMKGNYKWGNMKFRMMKLNMAKRRGISIDNLQLPKIVDRKNKHMEMSGKLVMDDYTRKNTNDNIKKVRRHVMKRINPDNLIKRQLTQKIRHITNTEDDINKLDIKF